MVILRHMASKVLLGTLAVLCPLLPSARAQDVVISEFMAVNNSTLADEDSDYPDWIELYNATSRGINLAGWSLTDDASDLQKWLFPVTNLPPHGFLVVFASDKNRAVAGQPLHTNFKLDGDGEYLALGRPGAGVAEYAFAPIFPAQSADQSYGINWTVETTVIPTNVACKAWVPADGALGTTWVHRAGFNDGAWQTGTSGVGYEAERFDGDYIGLIGLDLQSRMYNTHPTAYVRIPFDFTPSADVASAALTLMYDDGYVAYLNGSPIADDLAPATPAWNSFSAGQRADSDVLEPSTIPVPGAPSLLVSGENVLAFHLMNRSLGSSDLLLVPELTVAQYGLGSLTALRYFTVPSPGERNTTGYLGTADEPVFSRSGGTVATGFSLTLATPSPEATIRYTTDGTLPAVTSTPYASPIPVSATTLVRAQAFEPGLAPSAVRTETYLFVDASAQSFVSDLPLVVVDNLGAGDIPNLEPKQNAVIAFFDKPPAGNTTLLQAPSVQSRVGIRRRGESTLRPTNKKPNLGIETRDEEDDVARDIEPLGLPAESDWVLFAPWKWDPAFIRNTLAFELGNQMGEYASRTRFVEVFLNVDGGALTSTDYAGVYVLEERIKRDNDRVDIATLRPGDDTEPAISGGYIFRKDKVDPDKPEFSAGGVTLQWMDPPSDELTTTQKTWLSGYINDFYAALNNARFMDPEEGYAPYIDSDNWVRVNILNMFMKNIDWPALSTYFHKDRDGPIRQGPAWDFDRSSESKDIRDDAYDTWDAGAAFFSQYWWSRLFQDPNFWQRYIDIWQTLRDSTLSGSNVVAVIDAQTNQISNAVARDYARWPVASYAEHHPRTGSNGLDGTWPGEVTYLKWWLANRLAWVDGKMIDRPVFSQNGGAIASGYALTMTAPPGTTIYYTLDGTDPRAPGGGVAPTAAQYVLGIPVSLTRNTMVRARATDGSTFYSAPNDAPWSGLREAVFSVGTPELVLSELMYNPRTPSGVETNGGYVRSDFEFVEIRNAGDATVGLAGVRFTQGVDFDFSYGAQTSLEPGGVVVLVSNLDAFTNRYPAWTDMLIAGAYRGSLDDSGEAVTLQGPMGECIADFTYNDRRGWPLAADGAGHSLVPLGGAGQGSGALDYGRHWRCSTYIDGSPGRENPGAIADVVVNEIAAHTDYPPPFYSDDWVELINIAATNVALGDWYLSDDAENLRKWAVPGTNTIAGLGLKTFSEVTGFHNPTNIGFGLNKAGEQVFVSHLPGNGRDRVADAVRFKGQENGATLGRYPDGGAFWHKLMPTTNSPNAAPEVQVVIDEIMYHPAPGAVPEEDNRVDEFIELHNPLGQPVALWNEAGAWRLDGGLSYTFPSSTVIPAGGQLLLVGFDPETNAVALASFTDAYGPTNPATRMLGPYGGRLGNRGERVALEEPQSPDAPGDSVSWRIVDEVIYFARSPWPPAADGTGQSLQRLAREGWGNDSALWAALAPTPGRLRAKAAIVYPADGADVFVPSSTLATVAADGSQVAGAVQSVELFVGAVSLGLDTAAPYGFDLTGIDAPGGHDLRAEVTDGDGVFTTAVVRLNVLRLNEGVVSRVTDFGAVVHGGVTGSVAASLGLYWGATDGGTEAKLWPVCAPLGFVSNGTASVSVGPLDPGRTYYYRFRGATQKGAGWSAESRSFTTIPYAAWPHRMRIVLAGYDGATTLADFPALVRLGPAIDGFGYDQFASATGGDLRFSDIGGGLALPYEIEEWNTNGVSSVWVRVPSLFGTGTVIHAYWGNSDAVIAPPATTNGTAWSAFEAVWHLGPALADSGARGYGAVDHGTTDGVGMVGRGRSFDGTSAYIDPTLNPAWYGAQSMGLTLSAWVRADARHVGTVLGAAGSDRDLYLWAWADPVERFPKWGFGVENRRGLPFAFTQGDWRLLTLVLDSGQAKGFLDGGAGASIGGYAAFAPVRRVLMGAMNAAAGPTDYFSGMLDEVRVSTVARSSDWVRAEYLTVARNAVFTQYAVLGGQLHDGDSDGMPDGWENLHFGAPDTVLGGPAEDRDGDGASNLAEYLGGTDPTNAASCFVLGVRRGATGITVSLPTVVALPPWYEGMMRSYDLQGAGGLTGSTWQGIPGYVGIPATGGAVIHTNISGDLRFFRGKARLE